MHLLAYVGAALALACVAFVASLMGIGGGTLYTPLQVFFGIGIHEAAATSLFLIFILPLSATRVYRKAGKIDWRMALVLECATVAGGISGGFSSQFIPSQLLAVILAAALALASLSMLHPAGNLHPHLTRGDSWYLWHRRCCGEGYVVNLLVALPVSFVAGALSGMVGIGGGVLKVPMMVLLFGVPMDIAIATSGLMVGITAAGGFAGHLAAGHWDWRMSLILAPGVFAGAWFGAHAMLRLNKRMLRKAFGVLMLIVAVALVYKTFGGVL